MQLRVTVTNRPHQEKGELIGLCHNFHTAKRLKKCGPTPKEPRQCSVKFATVPIQNYVLDCPECVSRMTELCKCPDGCGSEIKRGVLESDPCVVRVPRGKRPTYTSCCSCK